MGFNQSWVDLIMNCITYVHYSIIVNGQPSEIFYPTRGIRKEDHLSLYLFLLCAKGLSSLVNHFDSIGQIHGLTVSRGGISLNHLLFADD